MGEFTGLLLLLSIGAIATILVLSAVIAHDAIHPSRHTAGYAVAHGLPTDPADKALPFEQWTLDLPGGAALPVWEITASGSGPTAVFVHGWGQSRIDMLAHVDPWLEKCARLVLYDRRGHGDASGSTARLGTNEHIDLRALLDRLGNGPYILVGHGSGAVVTIATAVDAGPDLAITAVAIYDLADDVHVSICDRLEARGLPTRPLTDLAMLWLRLIGIRQSDTVGAAKDLQCPLLMDCGPEAIPGENY